MAYNGIPLYAGQLMIPNMALLLALMLVKNGSFNPKATQRII